MSKSYFFMDTTPAAVRTTPVLPDVYCPVGGYQDKNLDKTFSSKGEKFRYLRAHKMREAEVFNPEKALGGTNGANIKQRGSRGNFRAKPMPAWMKKELERHVG